MATKEKNRQIVLLTVFAMTLVVIGHSDITSDFRDLWIYKWVYSFHMPLFFFISGFLFALTIPNTKLLASSFSTFIKKKAIRLLFPFLFINTIIFIIKATLIKDTSMLQNPVNLTINSFLDSTLFNPMGFMWFLPALFVIFIIAYALRKSLLFSNINGGGYLIGILLAILTSLILDYLAPRTSFMQISSAIHYISYFLLGILYSDYKKVIDLYMKKYRWAIIPIFLALSVSLRYGGLTAALSGIIFSVTFALLLEDKCSDKVVKISGLCYTVFLLSYFPQMLIRGPIAHMFSSINQYVLSGVSFCAGLILPIIFGLLFIKIKDKNNITN